MTTSQEDVLDWFARVHLSAYAVQPLEIVAVPSGRLDGRPAWSSGPWRCHGGHVGTAVDLIVVDAGTDPLTLGRLRPGGLAVLVGDGDDNSDDSSDSTDRHGLEVFDRADRPAPLTVLRAPTDRWDVPSPLASVRRGRLRQVTDALPAQPSPRRLDVWTARAGRLAGPRGRAVYHRLRGRR